MAPNDAAVEEKNTARAPEEEDMKGCWKVLFSCTLGNIALGGMQSSFGLFMKTLSEYFDTDMASTAAVGSVMMSTMQFLSPLTAAVSQTLGPTYTYFVGAWIITVSLILSLFSANIWMMIFLHGFLNGIGSSMVQIVTVTLPQHFFRKNKVMHDWISIIHSATK